MLFFQESGSVKFHVGWITYIRELVSSDFKFNPNSCIIDGLSTMVMEDNCVKVIGWYDNEWGYASRTADLVAFLDS